MIGPGFMSTNRRRSDESATRTHLHATRTRTTTATTTTRRCQRRHRLQLGATCAERESELLACHRAHPGYAQFKEIERSERLDLAALG